MRLTLTSLLGCSLWLATHTFSQAQSLQFIGSTANDNDVRGVLDAVAAPGKVYTANFGMSSLSIYDTSQPAAPKRISVLGSPGRPRTIVLGADKIYLACYGIGSPTTSSLQAIDVSNPVTPTQISVVSLPGGPLGIDTNGVLVGAISPGASGAFYVFDAVLKQLSSVPVANPAGIALGDAYAYIVAGSSLLTYDLSTPAAPVLRNATPVGSYTLGIYKMLLYNNVLYIPGSGELFSLSNPAAPTRQSVTTAPLRAVSGSTAYGTQSATRIAVYDVRTPTAPVLAASAPTANAESISVVTGQGDLVYGLNSSDHLQVFRYTPGVLSMRPGQAAGVSLYPNPSVADDVTLELPATTVSRPVRLYNTRGQLVREQVVASGSTRVVLHLQGLSAGLYVIKCEHIVQQVVRGN